MKRMWMFLALIGVILSLYCMQGKTAPSSLSAALLEQIQEDLAPFAKTGIHPSDLEALCKQATPRDALLRVMFKGGEVRFSSDISFSSSERTRSKKIKGFFKRLVKHYDLPDTELVICMLDACDERVGEAPLFVFAKRGTSSHNLLIPDFEALQMKQRLKTYETAVKKHPWATKEEKIFWRGATTGGLYTKESYLARPRGKLVAWSRTYPEWLDAAFSVLSQSSLDELQQIFLLTRPLSPHVSIPDHFAYKYLIDIDGNSCTYERCRWILLSNSTLLKPSSSNQQWYYKAMQPYVHFVPLKEDLSDLPQVYSWLQTHDEEAQKIAEAGRQLGLSLFTDGAIEAYVATLISEYSKLYKNP